MRQLSLWDVVPAKRKPGNQVRLIRQEDNGYDVVHILSGKFICHFRPILVRKADAQLFVDMLDEVDLDEWWLKGCPEDGTPRRIGKIHMEWRRKLYPGFFEEVRRFPEVGNNTGEE